MVAGARTGLPLLAGLVAGLCTSFLLLSPVDEPISTCPPQQERQFVDVSEHWEVHVENKPNATVAAVANDQVQKVVRARFAATELGMRDRLVVAVLAESSLAVALNASVGKHVPRIHLFADSARIDSDMAQLTNLSPYPLSDSRNIGQKSHHFIFGLMFNMSMHENYDWFLLVKDSTYVNPFELKRYVDSINWNKPVLIGQPDADGRCILESGVLLSNPALQLIMKNRQACNEITASIDSDQLAFERCMMFATNLSCTQSYQGSDFHIWKVDGHAAHDNINNWKNDPLFNKSITVTKLFSEADASALHDHFIRVELSELDENIDNMEKEVSELMSVTKEGPTWPAAIPSYSKPPNRYQVPTWEFFTMRDIFRNEQNQNVRPLEGKHLDDVMEVVQAARKHAENEELDLEFVQMRNGYRLFDSQRGMDYMIDLVYKKPKGEIVERRVHVSRMIASTQLLNQVPYVKEDTDITIVVPLNLETEVYPARRLLAHQARLCLAAIEETRKTRVVIAVSQEIDPRSVTNIRNDLAELKKRCHRSALEADVISVRAAENSSPVSAALDESIDRYGPNTIFVVLSPHADIQREFLDRVRINTIRKYQVFFPLPFVEYHPTISGMDVNENEIPTNPQEARDQALNRLREVGSFKRKRALLVQKDHGRFDSLDFTCAAMYGSDYVALRHKLSGKRLDLISVFLGQQDIHVLRAVEPTLRIRYYQRSCDAELAEEDYARCAASKRENVAAKDQLAKLLYQEQ
ncbi:unnamed protein product [Auanema sp. JU1783]|nr:unnamed protein product [Auanema sp. JU1783]